MRPIACLQLVPLMLLAWCFSGCRNLEPAAQLPLARPQMSSDSVALDLVFVQIPRGKREAGPSFWREVDEQSFDAALREQLFDNGFRVGLVGGQLPLALERQLGEKLKPESDDPNQPVDLQPQDLSVRKRHLQLRRGRRSEVIVSGIVDDWPLLVRQDEQVSGRTLHQAQGLFALKVYPQGDGRARIELVPELHHGSPQRQYRVGDEGSWVLDSGRPREVFDDLKIEATLSPGEMLLIGCRPQRPGSLGYRYFQVSDTPSGVEAEKLLLVRLAQTQDDDRFEP